MGDAEAGTPRAELFRGLAAEAKSQAGIWGIMPVPPRPNMYPTCVRVVAALARRGERGL